MALTCKDLENLSVPIYFNDFQSKLPTISSEIKQKYNENQELLRYYIKKLINCKNMIKANHVKKVMDNEKDRFEQAEFQMRLNRLKSKFKKSKKSKSVKKSKTKSVKKSVKKSKKLVN